MNSVWIVVARKILCFGFTLAENLVLFGAFEHFLEIIWQMSNILSPFEVGATLFCSVAAAGNVEEFISGWITIVLD